MDKISKIEFEILYYISRGNNDIERLGKLFNKEIILETIQKLDDQRLIDIEFRDNEIYGFMETQKCDKLLKSKMYSEWFKDCGD